MAIVVTRLLFVPPLGLAAVQTANKLGFLPVDDKLFRFVLLMQHSMPTSILAGKPFILWISYLIIVIALPIILLLVERMNLSSKTCPLLVCNGYSKIFIKKID